VELWWRDFGGGGECAIEELAVSLGRGWGSADGRAMALLREWSGLDAVVFVEDAMEERVGLLAGGGGTGVG
jgi:hypothetical protein